MNEPGRRSGLDAGAVPSDDVCLDGRHPRPLDHRDHALRVKTHQVDIFAVDVAEDGSDGARHHLFRVEPEGLILGLDDLNGPQLIKFIAVGTPGARAQLISLDALTETDGITTWIGQVAKVVTGQTPPWQMPELVEAGEIELVAGECGRGPMRRLSWVTLVRGSAQLMGSQGADLAEGLPFPLTSGMWIKAGAAGCAVRIEPMLRDPGMLPSALRRFGLAVRCCLAEMLTNDRRRAAERLANRQEFTASQTSEAFARLAGIIGQRFETSAADAGDGDALLRACRIVGEQIHTPITAPGRTHHDQSGFSAVTTIAQNAQLRVRQVLLRGEWWKLDVGPLVAWFGEMRDPVALIREPWRGYLMVDPRTGQRRSIDRTVAMQLAPEAATLYPPLPPRPLGFGDLLRFASRHSRGNALRILLSVTAIGLLSLVAPLITDLLINSIIPRSEIDQLPFCALALGLTAVSLAGVQTMGGLAMLRLEAGIDWKLQAALIDRLLRLPASLFRRFTAGEVVDRIMGVDAARRTLTGYALRGMMAGLFGWFSIGLMLYYDASLSLIAIALTLVRAVAIMATSAVRLYHETQHSEVQGRIGGFLLQLLSGVGKLRVAAATPRALAVWSRQFSVQRRHFIASQAAANILGTFEASFPTIATLIIFGYASYANSGLMTDVGGFLAFFSAFGQSMGAIGAWAAGLGEALVAIPPLLRLRPLIASAAEVAEERKNPGELSGAIELARVTFRYVPSGPPVLDDVSLKISQGEYVAIVGPSGSGKSSLFRLLLGFDRQDSGAVFYDGKSIDTLDIGAVRRQIGVVLQNARLATGSIYENICGGVRLPEEQAWDAARLAGLEDDLKAMPMGMLTNVSEGVSTLSGGQRQRIMIARAIARRPRILLFDEATSSLDNRSQAIVSDALGNLNVTRLVIAHRLSTVRRADRIIVLVNGRIEQSGTFDELSAGPGLFASFAKRQLL
ncbi:NHLP bacteriocin export ABC transporter permease/ATPase subunit [Bradyrhizobium sp. STM 3809]|uniref:NHLP bacteriocin export ABC transporter permease/ATPase subunit n=1 Tax=Bradyrhizobium sp. STM 3809 TaxID=551936 RepID=UPI0002409D2C|nr:NHLP bacteriocin export ABC transporter permease/ATPase subunit [Bradyrhizobium sp. STM 3809]CCE01694.1 putative ABC-type bacteriocin/lantibiotic exporter [Bradyrhizobium sp. STM 3809]